MIYWGWLAIAVVTLVASWALLAVLAARMPPGALKELPGSCPIASRRFVDSAKTPASQYERRSLCSSRASGCSRRLT